MRLIDADVLLAKLQRMIEYCESDRRVSGLMALFQVGDAIMDCPAIEAVEVVRCKDCKYLLKDNTEQEKHLCMQNRCARRNVNLDDFCSYGKRMEREENAVD